MNSQLTLQLDNVSTTVYGKMPKQIYQDFKKTLGYVPENALWQARSNPYFPGYYTCVCWNREYCRCAVKKDGLHFPTGLISKALNFFAANGIQCEIIDVRDKNIANSTKEVPYSIADSLKNGTPFNLYDYQKEAVEKAIKAQRGIIRAATGSGKTAILSAIIAEIGVKPTIFYVTSVDLLKQAADEIEQFVRLNGIPVVVGKIGGGYKEINCDITVMTIQTAVRCLDAKYIKYDDDEREDQTDISDIKNDIATLIKTAKLILVDECQHVSCESCQTIADHSISARWRYGASATPYRDLGDDILIDACFGKPIVNINASYLIDRGYLVKPTIAFIHIDNMRGQKLGAYPNVYKEAIVENTYRNSIVSQLSQNLKNQGRSVLVLIKNISHGEALQEMIPDSVFIHGSCTNKQREQHIKNMRLGLPGITIASTIFDEGIDVKPLNALILAGGGKSATRALQRIGRVIRPYSYPNGSKKTDAFVYDFHDVQKYITNHSMARRKIYRTEPQFDIYDFDLK